MDYPPVLHLNIIQYHLFHIKLQDVSGSLATNSTKYTWWHCIEVENVLIQTNVSSMRPSPSNPGSIQQFKPLFLQPPGPIIRQCWEGSDTRTNATLLFHAQLLSHLALQWLSYRGLLNSGFKFGLTLLTDFPLCQDFNITTAIPGSTT